MKIAFVTDTGTGRILLIGRKEAYIVSRCRLNSMGIHTMNMSRFLTKK